MSMPRVLVLSFIVSSSVGLIRFASGCEMPNQEGGGTSAVQPQPDPQQATASDRPGPLDDYRVGAGDTLEIQVVDHTEMNQTVRVTASGEITILPAGTIHVEDMTAAEVEARIASFLQEKELLKHPEVLVFVKDYQAKRIYLIGEFERPGEFVMSRHLTIMDAIFIAGGLRPFADRLGYLHRRISKMDVNERPPASALENPSTPREGTQILEIDLQPLADVRVVKPNVTLRQGDVFIVPRRQVESFFALGEVLRPNGYFYPAGQTMTASRAIAEAGGPTPFAKISKGYIIRYDKDGRRQDIRVDFGAILRREEKDIAMLGNDIIYIPASSAKRLGETTLGLSTSLLNATTFRYMREYQVQSWSQEAMDRNTSIRQIP